MICDMPRATDRPLSGLVREQIARPSPIRQIMKMAERQNILAMGLNPDDVISFGGGWVNHPAPEALRQAYLEIGVGPAVVSQERRLHGHARRCASAASSWRAFDSHLFGVPRLGAEHIAIGAGSTQLTHDLFRALLDPGDTVLLLDPTYANYEGQLAFAAPNINVVRLRVIDPRQLGVSAGRRRPIARSPSSSGCSTRTSRGW